MLDTVSDAFFFYTLQENSDVHLQLNLKWICMPDTASNEFFCYALQENSDVHLQLNLNGLVCQALFQINFYVTHCRKIAMFLCS